MERRDEKICKFANSGTWDMIPLLLLVLGGGESEPENREEEKKITCTYILNLRNRGKRKEN